MPDPMVTPEEMQLAAKVARRVGSKWVSVELDDLTSHLYLWMCTNSKAVARYRTEEGGQGKLWVALRREAGKYCPAETAHKIGQPLETSSIYTAEVLDEVLPYMFQEWPQSVVQVNPVTGYANVSSNPEDYGNAAAILADVTVCFHGLPKDDKRVLEYRYSQDLTYAEIGELENITKDGAKKRCARAVSRLAQALAGK